MLLGLLLVVSASLKLKNVDLFLFQFQQYQLLPPAWLEPGGLSLIWLEMVCGVGLCRRTWAASASLVATAIFTTFSLVITLQLALGRSPDCGCFGEMSLPLNFGHLAGTLVLSSLTLKQHLKLRRAAT